MKTLKIISFSIVAFFAFSQLAFAQIKNAKTETTMIYGNCNMCKKTIEKAANKKKTAQLTWDVDTKIATVTYDTTKTTLNEILKNVAKAGYDNAKYRAPDEQYSNLHSCCQYERPSAVKPKIEKSSN
ncbi:MAG: cation transporter [Saprospiraceae bacterium]|nr:cation transporter [Saprospiraceae bacterium]